MSYSEPMMDEVREAEPMEPRWNTASAFPEDRPNYNNFNIRIEKIENGYLLNPNSHDREYFNSLDTLFEEAKSRAINSFLRINDG